MRDSRNRRSRDAARQLGLAAILASLAVGAPFGCTREFYREWANQDVSEAVFEKSRDPRWRIDLFSVEPPMLSRFADPYDQDVPPAPPDDPATEALSPVPQWPDNRMLVPVEGTGYLDLLEYWRRDAMAQARRGLFAIGGSSAAGYPLQANEPEFWESPNALRYVSGYAGQSGGPGQPPTSPAGPPGTPSPFSVPPPVPPLGGGTGRGAPGGGFPRGMGGRAPGGGGAFPGPGLAPAGTTPTVPGGNPAGNTPSVPGGNPAGNTPTLPQTRNQRRAPQPGDSSSVQVVRLQSSDETTTARRNPPRRSERNQSAAANSGTKDRRSTPIPVSGATRNAPQSKIPPPRSGASFSTVRAGQSRQGTDRSLERASYRQGEAPPRPATTAGSGMRTEILEMATPGLGQPAPAPLLRGNQPEAPANLSRHRVPSGQSRRVSPGRCSRLRPARFSRVSPRSSRVPRLRRARSSTATSPTNSRWSVQTKSGGPAR